MDDTPVSILIRKYYPDGTTLVQRYPKDMPLEALGDTEPLSETWRDPEGNPMERPDPNKYPVIKPPPPPPPETPEEKAQREERNKRWRESSEAQEHYRRRYWEKRGFTTPEEVWAFVEALKEYERQLAGYGPVRRPDPDDFRGTSKRPSDQSLTRGPYRWPAPWEVW